MFGGNGDDELDGSDGVSENDELDGGPMASDTCDSDLGDQETNCELDPIAP